MSSSLLLDGDQIHAINQMWIYVWVLHFHTPHSHTPPVPGMEVDRLRHGKPLHGAVHPTAASNSVSTTLCEELLGCTAVLQSG